MTYRFATLGMKTNKLRENDMKRFVHFCVHLKTYMKKDSFLGKYNPGKHK